MSAPLSNIELWNAKLITQLLKLTTAAISASQGSSLLFVTWWRIEANIVLIGKTLPVLYLCQGLDFVEGDCNAGAHGCGEMDRFYVITFDGGGLVALNRGHHGL